MTPFTRWFFLHFSWLFCAFGLAAPQPGTPLIRNYSVLDYDASAQNWAIAQDNSGVMYFGNNRGVLIFDGSRWDLVPIAKHSMVTALAIDHQGTVFVGGAGEFGYLEPDSVGRPRYVSLSATIGGEDGIFGKVWNVHCTGHGVYFRARERMFRYADKVLEVIPLESHKRSAVIADAVLFNDRQYGLWVLDEKGPRMLPNTRDVLGVGKGSIILPYSNSKLLLAVRGLRLFIFDIAPFLENGSFRESFAPDTPGPVPWENEVDAYLLEKQLYTATALENGFALGTKSGGVVLIDHQGKLKRIINRDSGLFDQRVHAVFQDRHKNLWAALNNGLALTEINTPFSFFPGGKGSHEGVITLADFRGDLYVGAHNGLFHFNKAGHFQFLDQGPFGYWSFFPYKGRLLTASYDFFEIEQQEVRKIETTQPKRRTIYCFGKSSRFPDYFFGGNRDGVRVVKTGPASDKPLKIIEDFYLEGIHEEIRRIEADPSGNLWLSTRLSGLIFLEMQGTDPRDFRAFRFGKDHGLPRLDHCKMTQIQGVWRLATRAGIYRFGQSTGAWENPDDIHFVPDPDFSRFAGQEINQVFEDDKERIWVATTQEMGYFEPVSGGESVWYGQPFKRIGEGYLHVASDRSVWVDASMGLFRYTGDFKPVPARPFKTLIRKVMANDQLLFAGFLKDNHQAKPSPVLTMSRDNIGGVVSFDYGAAYFAKSETNRFRYILEGYDKSWSDWTKETHTNYTNLAGGTYRFRVESKNLYDQHGDIAAIELIVPKPWYHTNMAYLMFGLGLLGVLAGAMAGTALFQRKRHERRRQYELKQQELQKFETLGRLAGGIAHDFNGILATIYGFTHHIEKKTRDLPGLALPFEEIEKAGKRGKDLVSQILAFSRGDKPRNKMLHAGPELHKALDLAQITMPPKVTLVRRIDPQAGWLKGDPTRLHQVVINLFSNAVKALDGQSGTVEVGLERESKNKDQPRLRFWVRDTGIGMDRETKSHLFEPFYSKRRHGEGTGLGLWVVHGIVTSMGGTIRVDSSLGKGSLFEVFLIRQPTPVTHPAMSSRELPKGRGQRVLWVDSSKQRLQEGILLLRQLNYKASGALMNELPLADLEREPEALDLIIIGTDDATRSGEILLEKIRHLRPDIPIICCVTEKGREIPGSQGHLEVPLVPNSLAKVMFEAFAMKSPWEKGVIT